MRFGSLFAGVGGFDLGLERAGWSPLWQVEVDPFRRGVLALHWPDVTRYGDIREIDWSAVPRVDLVCGGFPCQDLSAAGKLAGLHGPRSGLHQEMLYAIEQLQPEWVLIENVYHTWRRWVPHLRRALWRLGYASVPIRLLALELGAPHQRSRCFITAGRCHGSVVRLRDGWRWPWDLPNPDGPQLRHEPRWGEAGSAAAEPGDDGTEGHLGDGRGAPPGSEPPSSSPRRAASESGVSLAQRRSVPGGWLPEPPVCRVADGVPSRVDRLSALGDAVVPQAVEWIGRQILEAAA